MSGVPLLAPRAARPLLVAIGIAGSGIVLAWLCLRPGEEVTNDPARVEETVSAPLSELKDAPPIGDRREALGSVAEQVPAPSTRASAKRVEYAPPADPRALPEATYAEILEKRARVKALLAERSEPLLAQRFDDNLAELIPDEQAIHATKQDQVEIHAKRTIPGQGTYRAALPRADYPELYELKDEAIRLDKLVGKMRQLERRRTRVLAR